MNKYFLPISVMALAALTGCGADSDSDSNKNEPTDPTTSEYTSISGVDASAGYAYFDLETGKVLELTDAQAATDTSWDLAFNGTSIILNGGYSGSGDVKAYFTGNNADFFDADGKVIADKFTAATPEAELADFTAVTSADIPASTEFDTDTFLTRFGSDFYVYNHLDHSISENANQSYLVSQDSGVYQVRVTELSNLDAQNQPGRGITEMTLGVSFKGASDSAFGNEQLVVLPECSGEAYVDLSAYRAVTESDSWDLNVKCSAFEIQLGDNVTAYALKDGDDALTFAGYASNEYARYYFLADGAETFFKDKAKWYQYNLEGGHKIWSQYGVYLVQNSTDTYKLQITSYYGVDSDSTVKSKQYSFIYQAL